MSITSSNDEDAASIENELDANEELIHPHIVLYHGYEQKGYVFDIVFEYCGSNLLKETNSGLQPVLITLYTSQLLEAVAFMHKKSWVHRDIKPSNIFLKSIGDKFVVKLGDFGSAHQISDDSEYQQTCRGQPARGSKGVTTHYSAPETHSNVDYGTKCDIWSIGCTVLEMITGKLPWTRNHQTLERQQAIFQMSFQKETPLTYMKELPTFRDDEYFSSYGTAFLERLDFLFFAE